MTTSKQIGVVTPIYNNLHSRDLLVYNMSRQTYPHNNITLYILDYSDNKDLSFSKLISSANFYKCGDDTTKPHYISWNPVKSINPDFHRPEHFGILNFQ